MVLDDVFQAAGMTSHVHMGDLATALASWLCSSTTYLPLGTPVSHGSHCSCRLGIGSARFVDFGLAVARLEQDGSNRAAVGDTSTCMVCSQRRLETRPSGSQSRSSADLQEARLAVCCALLDATMVKPGMLPSWGAALAISISISLSQVTTESEKGIAGPRPCPGDGARQPLRRPARILGAHRLLRHFCTVVDRSTPV